MFIIDVSLALPRRSVHASCRFGRQASPLRSCSPPRPLPAGAPGAQAVDFKIAGDWGAGFEQANAFPRGVDKADSFAAVQRFRPQITSVAGEALSGTVQFETGRSDWGRATTGGAPGADGRMVMRRFAYIDWMSPQSGVKVRMGIHLPKLPGVLSRYGFGPIFGKEKAGISVSAHCMPARSWIPALPSSGRAPTTTTLPSSAQVGEASKIRRLDSLDCFALMLPFCGGGWKLEPYAMYSLIGKYSLTGVAVPMGDSGTVAPRGGLTPILGDALPRASWGNRSNATACPNFQNYELHKLVLDWGSGFWARTRRPARADRRPAPRLRGRLRLRLSGRDQGLPGLRRARPHPADEAPGLVCRRPPRACQLGRSRPHRPDRQALPPSRCGASDPLRPLPWHRQQHAQAHRHELAELRRRSRGYLGTTDNAWEVNLVNT